MSTNPRPMDLDNMRSIGIRSIELWCGCGHSAVVNVDRYPGSYEVPAMRRLFRCGECGKRPTGSRPNVADMHRDQHGSELVVTEKRGPVAV